MEIYNLNLILLTNKKILIGLFLDDYGTLNPYCIILLIAIACFRFIYKQFKVL